MANNYCESSSLIRIPKEQLERAKEIVTRVTAELEADEEWEYAGYLADADEHGVWIRHNESIETDHAEKLVRALVEELELPGVHVVSWSYTCSKPRIDEFGGGAFAVQKGHPTVWVDAASEAERQALLLAEKPDEQ